ncbi:hypothetical protein RQP46_001612 [Phenoliferia psychrophenolica]
MSHHHSGSGSGYGSMGDMEEHSIEELQRLALQNLYLGSPNLAPVPPPTHQHHQALFEYPGRRGSGGGGGVPFALRTEDLALHNTSYPYSTQAELSVSPSASSQPINLASASSHPFFDTTRDSNSFDAFDSLSFNNSGAYTPSYGSWQSSYGDDFPSAKPSYSESVPSSRHSSTDQLAPEYLTIQLQQQQQQQQQFHYPAPPQIPYQSYANNYPASAQYHYRDPSFDQLSDPGRVSASPEWNAGRMSSFDEDSSMSDGRGGSGSQLDKDATLTPSDRQRQREQRARQLAQLQHQAGMSDGRPNVLTSHLSESPPTASGGFLSHEPSRASPALAPLAIPSGAPTPFLNLTEPTPATARPRQKGQGTLDLENAFDFLVKNEESRADERQSPQFINPPEQQQHFAPSSAHHLHPSHAHALLSFNAPSPPLGYQHNYAVPVRRRSKSETFSRQGQGPTDYALIAPTVGAASASSSSHFLYAASPTLLHSNLMPNHSAAAATAAASSYRYENNNSPAASYVRGSPDLGGVQRDFASRQKTAGQGNHPGRKAGGPGYESALPHNSNSNSTNSLLPDHTRTKNQALPRGQRTPYVYHSPTNSPSPHAAAAALAGGPGSVSGSEDGREVHVESKTTPATIEAAQRRRNPNVAARFVCELCGETFTRRYNLRGHQRAHRNEKPYACSYEGCEKAFARAHDCKRHELLHLGVRRYHCDPCQRDFVRLDALQRHHRSEIGQVCVNQLREAGFVIGYDTSAGVGADPAGALL